MSDPKERKRINKRIAWIDGEVDDLMKSGLTRDEAIRVATVTPASLFSEIFKKRRSANRPPDPSNSDRATVGPFVNWPVHLLPKCVWESNKFHSREPLNGSQRAYVLKLMGFDSYSAYLNSDLWQSIRAKVLDGKRCHCGCGKKANQVHHKRYCEDNLMGVRIHSMVPIYSRCHKEIEFHEGEKTSLRQANSRLTDKRSSHKYRRKKRAR